MSDMFEEYGGAIALTLCGLLILGAFLGFIVKIAGL